MKRINLLFLLCLLVGTLVSCEKEKKSELKPAEQDYLPTTAGSTWNYGGSSPYSVTATGATKVINSKTYHEIETIQGSTSRISYVVKENGVYTAIGMVSGFENLEVTILKEDTPVGGSWEEITNMNGADVKMLLSIVEKDVSKTVEGKTYNKVINVEMVQSFSIMGIDLGLEVTSHYYFAKGVGLILSELGTGEQVSLLSYNIK